MALLLLVVLGKQFLEEPLTRNLLLFGHMELVLNVLTRRVRLVSKDVLVISKLIYWFSADLTVSLPELVKASGVDSPLSVFPVKFCVKEDEKMLS